MVNRVQLYANDSRQLEIETFLETKGWFYERRRWQYRNRKVSRSRIRSILELAQVVIAAVLLEPETARARPRDRLKTDAGYRRVFSDAVDMSIYTRLLDMQDEVENYLTSPTALAISDDPTNDRFFVLAGAALRLSGVKAKNDYTPVVLKTRLKPPTVAMLEDVHKRLYVLVGSEKDKKERDKMFKGAALRDQFVSDILAWNATS